jgi:hypothetical protein
MPKLYPPGNNSPQTDLNAISRVVETDGSLRVLQVLYSKVELTAHVLANKGDRVGAERVLREAQAIGDAMDAIRETRAAKGESMRIATFRVPGQHDVALEQHGTSSTAPDAFTVRYGGDVRSNLGYRDACHNLGYAILHALSCAGRVRDSKD